MPDAPAATVEITEIGAALRRRLSWAEVCMNAELAGDAPQTLRHSLGGLPVARAVEERIDRTRKLTPSAKRRRDGRRFARSLSEGPQR